MREHCRQFPIIIRELNPLRNDHVDYSFPNTQEGNYVRCGWPKITTVTFWIAMLSGLAFPVYGSSRAFYGMDIICVHAKMAARPLMMQWIVVAIDIKAPMSAFTGLPAMPVDQRTGLRALRECLRNIPLAMLSTPNCVFSLQYNQIPSRVFISSLLVN